jgi:6-phospho-3-hexuloisomerase
MSDFETALAELGAVVSRIDDAALDQACRMLAGARRIGVAGCGRELLQMKGLAMRLFHLGLDVSVLGDVTMPPLGSGDVLLLSAGPGELQTMLTLMRIARDAGAKTLLLTAEPASTAAAIADFTLHVPAQTMARDQGPAANSVLPMGSVYEGALFLVSEVIVLRLKRLLNATNEAMRARHTNME